MEGLDKKKIIVVCGPTASGKSSLALKICHAFSGEMIGADSMQIYEGLVVGTAAVTPQEANGIPQHLTGFLPPEAAFSVADYVQHASLEIDKITANASIPVVCGGTGLYISSLVNGIAFTEEKPDLQLRAQLENDYKTNGGEAMLEVLRQLDPDYARKLHPNDSKRIIRGIEEARRTGTTMAQRNANSIPTEKPFNALCLGLHFEERKVLYERINQRVETMVQQGLLEEAKKVYEHRSTYKTAVQAIGYKEFFPYFEQTASLKACTENLQQATRNYAKRQLTWFKRLDGIRWLDASQPGFEETAIEMVREFLQEK